MLNLLLGRLLGRHPELLQMLELPQVPLHSNGTETDIRCYAERRKIRGGTQSQIGPDCREAFLVVAKTCVRRDISFWNISATDWARPAVPSCPDG